jgi:hypothetical protein
MEFSVVFGRTAAIPNLPQIPVASASLDRRLESARAGNAKNSTGYAELVQILAD